MKAIFFDNNGRLRSGWRAVVFLIVFLCSAFVLTLVEEALVGGVAADEVTGQTYYTMVNSSGLLLVALLIGGVLTRALEGKPFKTLGASFTNGWLKHWAVGCVLGALALLISVSIPYFAGSENFEVDPVGSETLTNSLLSSFLLFALAAAWEEAFFRGYLLQTFARAGFAWPAIAFMSAFFGMVHMANPSATAISGLNTMLAGVVFSLAYLKARDLWFPWGLHLMWNWMQGSIFGIEVSGVTWFSKAPLLREIDRGPQWLTGMSYGIEGSIACTIALMIAVMTIYFLPGIKPDDEVLRLNQPGS